MASNKDGEMPERQRAMASVAPLLETVPRPVPHSEALTVLDTGSSTSLDSSPAKRTPSLPSKPQLPRIGKIGVCAMDAKVLSKPCRQILNRLIEFGEFETVIFGDKVILDESIENWPTCDFLISFFSTGFPLDKAIAYVQLRKPFLLNDLVMQKALWDRRLVLQLLKIAGVPTPERLEISRDGGPKADELLTQALLERGLKLGKVVEPKWELVDDDTLVVEGRTMKKPFVEKPVDGEDHNIYIYYSTAQGGGGRRLFRKVGNKSSEFDPTLNMIRTNGSYIYEQFMDTDNSEDVKAYTVGQEFCHAETRKSPVVDGIVRRNPHGKEIRYVTTLSDEEKEMARNVSRIFGQTICGFDLLRVHGASYVIDVNGLSFVKDNTDYYNNTARILRQIFASAKREAELKKTPSGAKTVKEEKSQKWVFKGMVAVLRHADRTPKQKFKFSFKNPLFISLLKGHKEEVIIRDLDNLQLVLKTVRRAQEEQCEDPAKLKQLAMTLEKKMHFKGTKVQLKPVLNSETGDVEKVQLIIKWGGEPTHSAKYQATDLGEQMRQDVMLLNKDAFNHVKVYTSSERRVVASAKLWASAFFDEEVDDDFLIVRKDLLDDSNAAKDLMDKVKKKIKPLLRQGKEPPPQFAWPEKMPEPFIVIKRVVELMNYHSKLMAHNFATLNVDTLQTRWCCGEDPYLLKERWDKLFAEFCSYEKVDPSKISELYDTMKFDALHNRQFLEKIFAPPENYDTDGSETAFGTRSPALVCEYPVNVLAENNFRLPDSHSSGSSMATNGAAGGSTGGTTGSSSGSNSGSASSAGSGMKESTSPFDGFQFRRLRELYRLTKVLFDFICPQEYGIDDNEKLDIGLLTSLPLAKQILQDIANITETDTPACNLYFTKESHIYTLLNVIYESQMPLRVPRNALPELDYLSQIVFEIYESFDDQQKKQHSIRLSLSPGCHTQAPLDVQLDAKHYISCIPKFNLTRHLDVALLNERFRNRFSRVSLPQKFIPVSISSPLSPSPK